MAAKILGPTGGGRRAKRLLFMTAVVGLIIAVGVLATGGAVFAAKPTTTTVNDYSQCANGKPNATPANDPSTCNQGWINGILNANNSQYHEDQVTPQRLAVNVPKGAPTTQSVVLRYLARKGQGGVGNHAYDSLATWNDTVTGADRCNPALAQGTCPSGTASWHLIPLDPTVVADSSGGGSATSGHEIDDAGTGCNASGDCGTTAGPRRMVMFGGTITSISIPTHDNPSGSGDDFASVTVTYTVDTSASRDVELLFGGHLAASIGPRGWGTTVGSSFINGGPYHIKLDQVNGTSIGNRDNQITSGAILPQGTSVQTALHQTNSSGVDTGNTQDPLTQTGITVTLPADGTGAYVQDYATVAPSGSTGTVDFRYYSSSSACTAATNANEGGTDAGTGKTLTSDVAKSDIIHFTSIATLYWRAFFQATGINVPSSSGCSEEILTLNQDTTTGTLLHEVNADGTDVTNANNGLEITVSVGAHVKDVATVTPNSATGAVAFKYYGNSTDCGNDANGTSAGGGSLSSGSASSNILTLAAGDYYFRAFFTGTNGSNNSSSSCNEILHVNKGTPGVTTFPTLRPQDKATLSNITSGGSGTMSLTFTLYGPGNPTCLEDGTHTHVFQQSGVTVTANGDYNTTNTSFLLDSSSTVGVYKWKVDFFGNSVNNDVAGGCGDESFELGPGGIVDKSS
jgi:hypothetical protein